MSKRDYDRMVARIKKLLKYYLLEVSEGRRKGDPINIIILVRTPPKLIAGIYKCTKHPYQLLRRGDFNPLVERRRKCGILRRP